MEFVAPAKELSNDLAHEIGESPFVNLTPAGDPLDEPSTGQVFETLFEQEVIGADERTLVANALAVPNRWVCAIDLLIADPKLGKGVPLIMRDSRGTGILIGPCHVLTAKHVLAPVKVRVDNQDVEAPIASVRVSPARHGNNTSHPLGKASSKAIYRSKPYLIKQRKTLPDGRVIDLPITWNDDFALIILDQDPSGRTHTRMKGPLGYWGQTPSQAAVRRLDPANVQGREVTVIGYPGDRCGKDVITGSSADKERLINRCVRNRRDEWASTQWRSQGKVNVDPTTSRIEHTADTYKGESGGPICLRNGDVLDLLGVHVDQNSPGIGQPVTSNLGVRVTRHMLREICSWMNADAGYQIATIKDDALIVQPRTKEARETLEIDTAEILKDLEDTEGLETDESDSFAEKRAAETLIVHLCTEPGKPVVPYPNPPGARTTSAAPIHENTPFKREVEIRLKEHSSIHHPEEAESPFLDQNLFAAEVEEAWEPRMAALLSECPFRSAFKHGRPATIEPEELDEGELDKEIEDESIDEELYDAQSDNDTEDMEAEKTESSISRAADEMEGLEFESGEPGMDESQGRGEEGEGRSGLVSDLTNEDDEGSDEFEETTFEGDADDSEGDLDLEHLCILEFQLPPGLTSPTLGFEFDLNFGFEEKVTEAKGMSPPAGFNWPSEGLKATDHEWKDLSGNFKDAFVVTMDAVRMEIATVPFHIDNDVEFDTVVDNVQKFGQELIDAKKTHERNLDVPGVGGHPTTFEHPRTVVNKPEVDAHGNVKFPGDRDHASYTLEPVPLVIHRVSNTYPENTGLWSSPQATVTLPLAEFGKLVWEIHKTKGGAPGEAFTGRDIDRLGLRDDLAWLALTRAVADRKKKLGTKLSDGTKVTDADFTRNITSLVTILLMYMLTSIKKDDRDKKREQFAKGSLPLNVKTPLWQIHKFALTDDREKFILHELYTDSGKRENLFVLASGKTSGNSATKLFPDYTHWDAERFLGTSPTWHTLVDALVKEKPVVVTVENRLSKKGHLKGDEILIAPLSSKIDWTKTKPRIAVEMRRLGFDAVGFAKWPGLMKRVRELARKINP